MATATSTDTQAYTATRPNIRVQWSWNGKAWVNPVETLISNPSFTSQPYQKVRTWTRVDNYRTLKAAGVRLPDNSFAYDEYKNSKFVGRINSKYYFADAKRNQYSYRYSDLTRVVAVDPTNKVDANRVYAKLIDRAKGAQFNTPVFLAESRQTANMVVARAQGLVYGIRALRRGNVDGFLDSMHRSFTPSRKKVKLWKEHLVRTKRSSKGVADVWLEARYGWLPFMSEVYTAGQLLNELAETKENLHSRVSARLAAEWSTVSDITVVNLGADGGLKMTASSTFKEEVKAVWVFMPREWDALGRLGLTNPLEVVWELVPFSFVADWFLPIGNYLSYINLDSRFMHVGGTVGRKKEVTVKYSNPVPSVPGGGASVSGFGSASSYTVKIVRSPLLSTPIPSLESFSFEPKVNAKRVMDSISLLRQFFK